MENQKLNFFKTKISLFTFIFYIITFLIAVVLITYFYLNLNSSNEKVDKLDAEINTLKLTALELKERAERVTNNFASGGGTIIRIFETKDSTDVVKLEDYFSFDRYHLNYKSNSLTGEHFNWDTKNRGRIVFEEFISVKGIKAQGNQLTPHKIKQVNTLESLEYRPEDGESTEENDSIINQVKEDENDSGSAQTTLF